MEKRQALDVLRASTDTNSNMQLSVKNSADANGIASPTKEAGLALRSLAQLGEGEPGVLDHLELPEDIARRLMELGFLPGHVIVPARSAPGGEPRVYRVDGSEVALRRETAVHLMLKPALKASSQIPEP